MALQNKLMTDAGTNGGYGGGSSNPKIAAISNAHHSISNKALDIARAAQAGQASPYAKSGGGSTSGGGGSVSTDSIGGGSSGGGGGGGFDYSSYLNQLRAQADAAFNRAKSALDSTLNSTLGGLLESYNARKGALEGQYNNSKQTLTDDNAAKLRELYVNKMLNARDMAQLMTAQGLTGGMTETTNANMLNNYMNNRNKENNVFKRALADLLAGHESNMAEALANYNDHVANARNNYANYLSQLEMNRANMIASAMPSFKDLLNMV
jgi:hypothetical protein